jgi:hypothetical protein
MLFYVTYLFSTVNLTQPYIESAYHSANLRIFEIPSQTFISYLHFEMITCEFPVYRLIHYSIYKFSADVNFLLRELQYIEEIFFSSSFTL